jgi:hypothetical protein
MQADTETLAGCSTGEPILNAKQIEAAPHCPTTARMSEGTLPYIGSRISLISKSEIRYEGTLYTINTQESTVALQNGE